MTVAQRFLFMTSEQKRIAIAEACGWKREFDGNHEEPEWYWIPPNDPDGDGELPDYLNDLNAMHEAEKMLTPLQWFDYSALLTKIVGPKDQEYYLNLHATAAERAEAFGLTLQLW